MPRQGCVPAAAACACGRMRPVTCRRDTPRFLHHNLRSPARLAVQARPGSLIKQHFAGVGRLATPGQNKLPCRLLKLYCPCCTGCPRRRTRRRSASGWSCWKIGQRPAACAAAPRSSSRWVGPAAARVPPARSLASTVRGLSGQEPAACQRACRPPGMLRCRACGRLPCFSSFT